MSKRNRTQTQPATEIATPEVTAPEVTTPEVTAPAEQPATDPVAPPADPLTAPLTDAEIAAAQATEQQKQNWRNPESVQDRHIMANLFIADGKRTQEFTPVDFAKQIVKLRQDNGTTTVRSHAEDARLINIGPKTYVPRASVTEAGSKNEYRGYWALVQGALKDGPKTQRELATLVGRLDFIRYCLNRHWLAFVPAAPATPAAPQE